MGALYRLGQKFVDFCNVVQNNQNNSATVPSSAVLYNESKNLYEYEYAFSVSAWATWYTYTSTRTKKWAFIRGIKDGHMTHFVVNLDLLRQSGCVNESSYACVSVSTSGLRIYASGNTIGLYALDINSCGGYSAWVLVLA